MVEPRKIYFVIWPDGKTADAAPGWSEEEALRNFLTESCGLSADRFGSITWGHLWGGGALYYIWPAMKDRGFKIGNVVVPPPRVKGEQG